VRTDRLSVDRTLRQLHINIASPGLLTRASALQDSGLGHFVFGPGGWLGRHRHGASATPRTRRGPGPGPGTQAVAFLCPVGPGSRGLSLRRLRLQGRGSEARLPCWALPEATRKPQQLPVLGAVAQHATVPSQSETREAVGAVVQHATVPGESETRDEAMSAVTVVQHATVTQ
jgi:hypothetical protein